MNIVIPPIPDTVKGALVALAGVVVTLVFSTWQQSRQLRHASRQADRQRAMDLRKDVYLRTAESLMRGYVAVSQLSNIETKEIDVGNRIADCAADIGKIHVVAREDTVEAIMNFQGALTEAFHEIMIKRLPLRQRAATIRDLQELVDAQCTEKLRCHEQIMQLSQSEADSAMRQQLSARYSAADLRQRDHMVARDRLKLDQLRSHPEFIREMIPITLGVSKMLPDASLRVRAEMEVNEEKYRRVFNSNMERALRLVLLTVERVKEIAEKGPKP